MQPISSIRTNLIQGEMSHAQRPARGQEAGPSDAITLNPPEFCPPSNGVAHIVSGLQAQFAPQSANFSVSQGPSTGMQSGFVASGQEISGMRSGMSAGGVFTHR
ncbi:MAG: hypothetical protein KC910_15365 [Candidatus Eremiobacteraeota bacterium]|nr:hypothetical protein [Candidatus Eremiobacteraeota bacterium]